MIFIKKPSERIWFKMQKKEKSNKKNQKRIRVGRDIKQDYKKIQKRDYFSHI